MKDTVNDPSCTHVARTLLEQYHRQHPGIWKLVAEDRAKHGAKWPKHVFLASEGAVSILQTLDPRLPQNVAVFAQKYLHLEMFAAWRNTQGIYRFDRDIYSELTQTPLDKEIPVEMLENMPEWCVYLETPGMTFVIGGKDTALLGSWVWVDWIGGLNKPLFLTFGLHTPSGVICVQVPLLGNVKDSLAALLRRNGPSVADKSLQRVVNLLVPVVSLLLYLCSEAPEVLDGRGAPQTPTDDLTTETDVASALSSPVRWDVGVRMGNLLRLSRERAAARAPGSGDGDGGTVRPHFRRAHWAIRWIGPMDGERKAVLRWIHPVLVNAASPEELPSTIKPVGRMSPKTTPKTNDRCSFGQSGEGC